MKKTLLLGMAITSAVALTQHTAIANNDQFQLLSPEEAVALQHTLSELSGEKKRQFREAMYKQLQEKASDAGYSMPAMPPVKEPAPIKPVEPTKLAEPEIVVKPVVVEAIKEIEVPVLSPAPTPVVAKENDKPAAPQAEIVASETPAPVAPEKAPAPAISPSVAAPAATSTPSPVAAPLPNNNPPTARKSRTEIIASMEAHRAAMREHMQQRRDAQKARHQQRVDAVQKTPAMEKIKQQRALHEQRMQAYNAQMEARRKAMQARIDHAIQGMAMPQQRPYPGARR